MESTKRRHVQCVFSTCRVLQHISQRPLGRVTMDHLAVDIPPHFAIWTSFSSLHHIPVTPMDRIKTMLARRLNRATKTNRAGNRIKLLGWGRHWKELDPIITSPSCAPMTSQQHWVPDLPDCNSFSDVYIICRTDWFESYFQLSLFCCPYKYGTGNLRDVWALILIQLHEDLRLWDCRISRTSHSVLVLFIMSKHGDWPMIHAGQSLLVWS